MMKHPSKTFANALLLVSLITTLACQKVFAANICDTGEIGLTKLDGSSGVGGTGHEVKGGEGEGSGVGGTGNGSGTGVGGTGDKIATNEGVTEAIGIITGFASICVNGVEFHYSKNTNVDNNGQPSNTRALEIGQVVHVEGIGHGQEVNARSISIQHVMSGPVTRILPSGHVIEVMGSVIDLSKASNQQKLNVGDHIMVSGLVKPNGNVQVTRIDKSSSNLPSFVTGLLDSHGKLAGVSIASANLTSEGAIKVSGQWDGKALIAKEVSEYKVSGKLNPASEFHIQGYLGFDSNHKPIVNGVEFDLSKNNRQFNDKILNDGKVIVVHGFADSEGKPVVTKVDLYKDDKVLDRGGHRTKQNEVIKPNNGSMGAESSRSSTSEKSANSETMKAERIEKTEQLEEVESVEKPEKVEKIEVPEKIEKPEKVEKIEVPEKIEKPEKVEKIEVPEKIEKPEKVEKPEAIEKPEKKN